VNDRLLASDGLSRADQELLRRVAGRISDQDDMYDGDDAHYFTVGLSAIHCIDEALRAAGISNVNEILDLPCGYGRVLRFLGQRFPAARITACDLVPDRVRFCVEHLGAVPAYSSYDLNDLQLERQFDLIWCGSLITHLDPRRTLDLLAFFARHLAPRGLVICTTHGEFVADSILDSAEVYGLPLDRIRGLLSAYRQRGYGYRGYSNEARYGVSLTRPAWLRLQARATGDLHEVYFRARGWDDHQDVFGFVKNSGVAVGAEAFT
jgi:SAM-dependent methyltransferase